MTDIQAVFFDVNGTLVEIETDEGMEQIFRAAAHLLTYQGIDLRRHQVRDFYFEALKEQQRSSPEEFPEFDAVRIWQTLIEQHQTDFTRALPAAKVEQLPLFLAELSRGISRRRLRLFPHVRRVLNTLREHHVAIALVTDAQSAWARGELHKVGLLEYFDVIVVSGDHGFRKPDRRLFQFALDAVGVPAANTLYVGNDMYRDVFGAGAAGLQTVMFNSNQGMKIYKDCEPDHTINDHRDLLKILGLPDASGLS